MDSISAYKPFSLTDTPTDELNPVPQINISSPGCAGCAVTLGFRAIANSVVPANETTPWLSPGVSSEKIHGEALCIAMLKGSLAPVAVSTTTPIAVPGSVAGQRNC